METASQRNICLGANGRRLEDQTRRGTRRETDASRPTPRLGRFGFNVARQTIFSASRVPSFHCCSAQLDSYGTPGRLNSVWRPMVEGCGKRAREGETSGGGVEKGRESCARGQRQIGRSSETPIWCRWTGAKTRKKM